MLALALTTVLLAWPMAIASGAAPGMQAAANEDTPYSELRTWLGAVAAHRPGDFDRAAVEIASWSERELRLVLDDLRELGRFLVRAYARLRQSGELSTFFNKGRAISLGEAEKLLALTDEEARAGNLTRILTRGALLHTDIAIMLDDYRDRTSSPGSAPTALLTMDGHQRGLSDRGPHWPFARMLMDLYPRQASPDNAARRWYFATAALMQGRGQLADLFPHLAAAERLFADDAGIQLCVGMMHEAMASPEVQDAIDEAPLPPGLKVATTSARVHLQEARTAFGRALREKPDLVEARVRLGRVLGLLARHEEAVRELDGVAGTASDDRLRYFAALFLGAAREALGRGEAARSSFARAAAIYPRAQSPHLALSRLARAAGDHAGAVAALDKLFALPSGASAYEDPWWRYHRGVEAEAGALVAEWRRSIAAVSPR